MAGQAKQYSFSLARGWEGPASPGARGLQTPGVKQVGNLVGTVSQIHLSPHCALPSQPVKGINCWQQICILKIL